MKTKLNQRWKFSNNHIVELTNITKAYARGPVIKALKNSIYNIGHIDEWAIKNNYDGNDYGGCGWKLMGGQEK